MAFIQKGAGGPFPLQSNPRSIVITSKATPTVLILKSDDNADEFDVICPAFQTLFLLRPVLQDRFATGPNLKATITGDANSFVRIDG